MVYFKACNRCRKGDVIVESDIYGSYSQCLQCGHITNIEAPVRAGLIWAAGRHFEAAGTQASGIALMSTGARPRTGTLKRAV